MMYEQESEGDDLVERPILARVDPRVHSLYHYIVQSIGSGNAARPAIIVPVYM